LQFVKKERTVLLALSASEPLATRGIKMRTLKVFGLAFVLAGAAFVFTMLKDPPKSVASDPTQTIQPNEIKIQTGIPSGDYDAN